MRRRKILMLLMLLLSIMAMKASNSETAAVDFYGQGADEKGVVRRIDVARDQFWFSLDERCGEADDAYFNKYVEVLDSMDVAIKWPEGFSPFSRNEASRPFWISPDPDFESKYKHGIPGGSINGPVLANAAKEALLIYPLCIETYGTCTYQLIEEEFMGASGNDDIDITNLITVIPGKDAPGSSNADEVIVYQFDSKDPVVANNRHIIGVVLMKKGHYPMAFKIALNDAGLAKKDEYISTLLKNVKFGNTSLPECVDLESQNRLNTPLPAFPLKKREKTYGIIKD